MVSSGTCNIDKEELLRQVSEADIAARYLGVHEIPCVICSPIRQDKHPSFRLYSPDGIKVRYYDYATKDSGGILDLVMRMFNLKFTDTIGKIYAEMTGSGTNHISVKKSDSPQNNNVRIYASSHPEYKVRSRGEHGRTTTLSIGHLMVSQNSGCYIATSIQFLIILLLQVLVSHR